MNNGDDTAFYLHKGFRVVGIEADPTLVRHAEERFRKEIAAGRLTVLNVAVAEEEGVFPFWICDAQSEWNSFDREIASREGSPHHQIQVSCRRFATILEEYGVPHYLKVDIEGNDHLCIEALGASDTPKYLSVEQGGETRALLSRLAELGYTGFKCISQVHLLPLQREPSWEQRLHESLLRLRTSSHPTARLFRRFGGRRAVGYFLGRRRRLRGWAFATGSSGPFGEETPGVWLDLEEFSSTLDYFHALREAGQRSIFWNELDYSFWADFHARRDD